MRRYSLILGAAALCLTACTPEEQEAIDSMMQDSDSSIETQASSSSMPDESMTDTGSEDGQMATESAYADYDDSVLTNGETKVLFFHAAWCPVCRAADKDLTAWYNAGLPTVNVYKVDYDTETALKAKFGVTYQHTFVLVDGQGNAIQTIQSPSGDALKGLIGA